MQELSLAPNNLRKVRVYLFGQFCGENAEYETLKRRLHQHHIPLENICTVQPPSDASGSGFQTVQQPRFGTAQRLLGSYLPEPAVIAADGAILPRSGFALTITSRDCPLVVLENRVSDEVSVFHAGRPALTPPPDCATCPFTVVKPGLDAVLRAHANPAAVHAFVTAGICTNHFSHEQAGAETYTEPFRQMYGETVFGDTTRRTLNLRAVIRQQLAHRGVREEHILMDDRCTFSDGALASKRANKPGHNLLLVIRPHAAT